MFGGGGASRNGQESENFGLSYWILIPAGDPVDFPADVSPISYYLSICLMLV